MKKVTKKLELNKHVVANLNNVFGGQPQKTWNCGTKACTSDAPPMCPQPTNTCNLCNSNKTVKVGGGCTWNTEFTCSPSNGETCYITETYVSCPCTTSGC